MIRILSILLIATFARAAVVTTEFYDDRDLCVIFSNDDMHDSYGFSHKNWKNFVEAAEDCAANHMVFQACINPDRVKSAGWTELQNMLADPYFAVGNHSATHPWVMATNYASLAPWTITTNYINEYIGSAETIYANLNLPTRLRYNGEDHLTVFQQFGASDVDDYLADAVIENSFLGNRNPQWVYPEYDREYPWWNIGRSDAWPVWENHTGTNTYEWIEFSTTVVEVRGSGYEDPQTWRSMFNHSLTNRGYYTLFSHVWRDEDHTRGANSNLWSEVFDHIGNRHNVWYSDYDSSYSYRYLQTQAAPTISITSSNEFEIIFSVTGNATERAKYGLSHPLTYKVDKPDSWAAGVPYTVRYRDTGAWSAVSRKTTNDWYNAINCYRDNGENILVSQALPQASDSFEIHIRKGRFAPAFLSNGGG